MFGIDESKAIRINVQRAPCRECKGAGKIVIMGRTRSLKTGKPDVMEMPCPCCNGGGMGGLRTKG